MFLFCLNIGIWFTSDIFYAFKMTMLRSQLIFDFCTFLLPTCLTGYSIIASKVILVQPTLDAGKTIQQYQQANQYVVPHQNAAVVIFNMEHTCPSFQIHLK
jgi:hypothetical protein